MRRRNWCFGVIISLMVSCNDSKEEKTVTDSLDLPTPSLVGDPGSAKADTSHLAVSKFGVETGKVQPQEIVEFAKTLIGTKYKYGSTDPKVGFDCSGFITYVFNHFNIKVPRSSIDFTDVGRTIPLDSAKAGDLILFTGTDSTERHIGHMGIITSNEAGIVEFIHSTSGKLYGVTITPLNGYYIGRFMRIARVFTQNEK